MTSTRPWLPYILPFVVYMAFLTLQSNDNLLWMYPLKTITVAAVLWYFRKEYAELRIPGVVGRPESVRGGESAYPAASGDAAYNMMWAVLIGLVVIVIWIGIDPYYPKFGDLMYRFNKLLNSLIGKTTPAQEAFPPFDPTTIANPAMRYAFIGFRVFGATVVVAFMEEIFWRGFMIRWLIKEDFRNVPMGAFTWSSFWITVLMFGAEHNQWLAGICCGALYNWLYYRRKDLFSCVVAHGVSNAALAAWVLARDDWKFW